MKKLRILAIGECMAELAPAGAPDTFRMGFAGDTFNTAWYLAKLNQDLSVGYFTAIGDDETSARMRDFIGNSGIDASHVVSVPGLTVGLYLISLKDGERSFSYWRGQSAARRLADDPKALIAAMDGADMVYFSGITLAILEPAARATFLSAVADARQAGKTIAFDSNLRPRLWPTGEAMMDATMEGAAVSDIVLPSYEDEHDWFGDTSPMATAQRYADAGAKTVIVKNGPDPVLYLDDGRHGQVSFPKIDQIVDTTAAGDSFNAGFLAGHGTDASIADRIAQAASLAGQVVQGKGALVDIKFLQPAS